MHNFEAKEIVETISENIDSLKAITVTLRDIHLRGVLRSEETSKLLEEIDKIGNSYEKMTKTVLKFMHNETIGHLQ